MFSLVTKNTDDSANLLKRDVSSCEALKNERQCHDWVWFYFWLDEKVAQEFFSQSFSVVMLRESKRKTLWTVKWKVLLKASMACFLPFFLYFS